MVRKIAVIGGGVTGTSVAWHLASRDAGEIVLLERDRLGSGTTWHSAGNITWVPGSDHILTLFDTLDQVARESEQDTGWLWTGRLFLARTEKTLDSFRSMAVAADAMRFENAWLDPQAAAERHPLLHGDRLAGAWFNSRSGRVNPADLTAAYARAARRRGVTIREGCNVTGLDIRNGRVKKVCTDDDDIEVDDVVICCGLWSRRLLSQLGLLLPQWGCEHFYVIARTDQRLDRTTPSFVSPNDLIYGREEVGDLLLGCFDEGALTLDAEHGAPPDDFSFSLLDDNWDKLAPYAERAAEHFPALEQAQIRRFVNGPESFTPDGEPLLGPFGNIAGLHVASAMNSAGVTYSALAGHVIADTITEAAEPKFNPQPYAADRFAERACDESWLREKASDVVSGHYRERFES
ncbi:MAG: FAD-binding oxidoreductase [Alphaproteobacteria bacterium]|mgnify:CR=1 FL=1|nr:FAD-binding oxidoreductase [Rhodospirillaceae bacterium]MBT6510199.1 FAD-binding oxidoreductase [Rhodospirillaceae bacterium]MDG2481814.1 FAD-binding oxidoreductase [Alphaproteobacteria bacterium]